MNLLQRAKAGLPLTPGERAILKALSGLFISALIAGMNAAVQFFSNPGAFNWIQFAWVVLTTIVFTFALSVAKYISANGDAPLGDAMQGLIEAIIAALQKAGPVVLVQHSEDKHTTGPMPNEQQLL